MNSLSIRAFSFSTWLFTYQIKSFLISFKTTGEILFVSLEGVLGRTAQKMKFSIKDFFSIFDQIAGNCGFGHIY